MSTQKKGWKEIPLGGVCWISSTEYKTGDWRSYKPVWNTEKCTRCILCHMYCPEGAIKLAPNYEPEVELAHCKGCGICAKECPMKAITMKFKGEMKDAAKTSGKW